MRAHFKQSIQIGETTYKNGSIHSLSKDVMSHHAFKFFRKAGLIVDASDASIAAMPITERHRLETLAAKLAPQKVVSDPDIELQAMAESEDYEPEVSEEVSEEDFNFDDDETEEDESPKKSVKKKAKKKR